MEDETFDLFEQTPRAQVQTLYIAYFGRAADPAGLNTWLGERRRLIEEEDLGETEALESLAASFGDIVSRPPSDPQNTEGRSFSLFRFPFATSESLVADFVERVFNNLFERDPGGTPGDTTTGLGYWTQEILARVRDQQPVGDAIVDIVSGASNAEAGQDRTVLTNKIAVAEAYTGAFLDALNDGAEWNDEDRLDARNVIGGVDATDTAVSEGVAKSRLFAFDDIAEERPDGLTVTLSETTDRTEFSSGADTVNGVVRGAMRPGTTLQAGDVVRGGGGVDTLSFSLTGNLDPVGSAPNAKDSTVGAIRGPGIERVAVANLEASPDDRHIVNLSLFPEIETIRVTASTATGDMTFRGMPQPVELALADGRGDVTLEPGAGTEGDSVQAITLGGVAGGRLTVSGHETFDITTERAGSTLANVSGDELETLRVTGNQDFTVSEALDSDVTTIDASDLGGNLDVQLAAGTTITVTAGSGDDTVTLGGALTEGDTIDLGAGTADTVRVPAGDGETLRLKDFALSNVENFKVRVTGTDTPPVVDLDGAAEDIGAIVGLANYAQFSLSQRLQNPGDTLSLRVNGESVTLDGDQDADGNANDPTNSLIDTTKDLVAVLNDAVGDIATVGLSAPNTVILRARVDASIGFSDLNDSGGNITFTDRDVDGDLTIDNIVDQPIALFSGDNINDGMVALDTVRLQLAEPTNEDDSIALNLGRPEGRGADLGTETARIVANGAEAVSLSADALAEDRQHTIGKLEIPDATELLLTGAGNLRIGGTEGALDMSAEAEQVIDATGHEGRLVVGDPDNPGFETADVTFTGSDAETILFFGGTLNSGDNAALGAGDSDTLVARIDGVEGALDVTGAETVVMRSRGTSNPDMMGLTATKALHVVDADAGGGLIDLDNLAADVPVILGIEDAGGDSVTGLSDPFTGRLDVALADAGGVDDSLSVRIVEKTDDAVDATLEATAIETLDLTVGEKAGDFDLDLTDFEAGTVNLGGGQSDGDADLTLEALPGTGSASRTVDAEDFAGTLTLAATTSDDDVTVTGGEDSDIRTGTGDDTVALGEIALDSADVVKLGGGSDSLNATLTASDSANASGLEDIETLDFQIDGNAEVVVDTIGGMDDDAVETITLAGGGPEASFSTLADGFSFGGSAAIETIDASGMSGRVLLGFDAGTLDSDIAIKGASGDSDFLATGFDPTGTETQDLDLAGIEIVSITLRDDASNDGTQVFELDEIGDPQVFEVSSSTNTASADVIKLTDLTDATTVRLGESQVLADFDATLALELASDGGVSDVVNLALLSTDTVDVPIVDLDNAETVNLDLDTGLSGAQALDLSKLSNSDGNSIALNITDGAEDVALGLDGSGAISDAIEEIDAGDAVSNIVMAAGSRDGSDAMTIHGGEGDDSLEVIGREDVITGGEGVDTLIANASPALDEGVQVDLANSNQVSQFGAGQFAGVITGFENVDLANYDVPTSGALLQGNEQANVLTGTDNDDDIRGRDGNDRLAGGGGADAIFGGKGADTILVAEGNTAPVADVDGGSDTNADAGGQDTLQDFDKSEDLLELNANVAGGFGISDVTVGTASGGGVSDFTTADSFVKAAYLVQLDGAGAFDIASNVTTDGATPAFESAAEARAATALKIVSTGAGTLTGGENADQLIGQSGSQNINAGAGDDVIKGGADADQLRGQNGNDDIDGGDGNDTVLDGGNGNDTIRGGNGNDQLQGGSGSDTLEGGSGSDTLTGGGGSDTLTGGVGIDTLTGGAGDDTFVFTAQGDSPATNVPVTADTIADFSAGSDTLDLSALDLDTNDTSVVALGDMGGNNSFDVTADRADLFNDAGTDRAFAMETDGTGGAGRLFIDLNGSGDFETANDMAIEFTGVQSLSPADIMA